MVSEQTEWYRTRQWKNVNEVRRETWNVGILCVKTDITKCKIANRKEKSKNGADWEKPIKEVKVRIGL